MPFREVLPGRTELHLCVRWARLRELWERIPQASLQGGEGSRTVCLVHILPRPLPWAGASATAVRARWVLTPSPGGPTAPRLFPRSSPPVTLTGYVNTGGAQFTLPGSPHPPHPGAAGRRVQAHHPRSPRARGGVRPALGPAPTAPLRFFPPGAKEPVAARDGSRGDSSDVWPVASVASALSRRPRVRFRRPPWAEEALPGSLGSESGTRAWAWGSRLCGCAVRQPPRSFLPPHG